MASGSGSRVTPADAGGAGPSQFLVLFAHHNMYFNMRFQELEALALMLGVESREELYVGDPPTALSASPLAFVRLSGGEAMARKICERSVLIRAVLEVWATGPTYTEAVQLAVADGEASREKRRHWVAPPNKFQIRVAAFGKSLTMDDKKVTLDLLKPLFDGDEIADLHSPDTVLWAFEEHEHQTECKTHLGPRTSVPQRCFFCRQVAGGRNIDRKLTSGEKPYYKRYDLSDRAVLGPTTMDNEIAFIMANCGQVRQGQTALEPFCGTGGLMIPLAHFGAHVVGGEIDIRVVRGWRIAYIKNKAAALEVARKRGLVDNAAVNTASANVEPPTVADKSEASSAMMSMQYLSSIGLDTFLRDKDGERATTNVVVDSPAVSSGQERDIFTNFVQYGLPLPEVVICDNSMTPWRKVDCGWCDCIVTDPPYGVRAGAKRQGRDADKPVHGVPGIGDYIPSKVNYSEDELASDMMTLATDALRDGGRLVQLVPLDLADLLGIDRAQTERGGGPRATATSLHKTAHPEGGRKKDKRLCISETTRDPLLLDESRYTEFIPSHPDMELLGASLQVLSGGLGRLLVTMRRRNRVR